jgi:hypothetical protein
MDLRSREKHKPCLAVCVSAPFTSYITIWRFSVSIGSCSPVRLLDGSKTFTPLCYLKTSLAPSEWPIRLSESCWLVSMERCQYASNSYLKSHRTGSDTHQETYRFENVGQYCALAYENEL